MVAERTLKSVNATDRRLKDLLRYKHIKIIPYPHKNDGCCSRYQLTPKGKKYLRTLENRFLYGKDLNLKYSPRDIQYTDETISWKKRAYPPSFMECSGNEYEFKLSTETNDRILVYHKRDLTFFTKEEKKYAIGDYFRIYDLDSYVLYYIESFSIQEYANVFSKYRTPRDPEQYLLKLQTDHPESKYVYILYFRKYKAISQETTTYQRIANFLNDKNPTNDTIGNSQKTPYNLTSSNNMKYEG